LCAKVANRKRHYTEKQIGQLWSGNLLRVWGEVDNVAKKLQTEGANDQ
jgi:microsomal dipeptidase-like Zn-dependent dipeptidase